MSTKIECTNCTDVVEVEARNVELPYVCNDCELRAAMAPIKPARLQAFKEPAFVVRGATYDVGGQLISPQTAGEIREHEGLDDSSATVENTTLLIEDLEQQVTAATDGLKTANELISDMSAQLQEDAAVLGERDSRIASLEEGYAKYQEAHRLNERLQQDIGDVISKLDNVRSQRNVFAIKNVELEAKAFQQREHVARFAGQMFDLAGEWDKQQAELESEVEFQTGKAQRNYAALEGTWAEIRDYKSQIEVLVNRVSLANTSKDFYKRQAQYFRERAHDLVALTNRGFFARVFNKKS